MSNSLRSTLLALLALSVAHSSMVLAKPRAESSGPMKRHQLSEDEQQALDMKRMVAASSKVISDRDLLRYARSSYDKSSKMHTSEFLGVHNGQLVVADFPCSDLCPKYTKRIIHYDVEATPKECDAVHGVIRKEDVPAGIAFRVLPFCEPRVLLKAGTAVVQ